MWQHRMRNKYPPPMIKQPGRADAEVTGASPQVTENAAELALEHHLGMTCDPVAGYVQVPCIERCAFGAVKAWTAFLIATNEIGSRHRVDLDTTIKTLADTGRDMSTKYKETSEAGLAANLVLLLRRKRFATKPADDQTWCRRRAAECGS